MINRRPSAALLAYTLRRLGTNHMDMHRRLHSRFPKNAWIAKTPIWF